MAKTQQYFFSADLIRALAIIFVVLIHVFSEFLNYPKVLGSSDWWIADFFNSGARVAVPLFIMLSGMLLLHTDKNYTIKEFLKKRASKIGVPLIIWTVIYFLWKTWLNHEPYTFMSILKDYLNLNIYYHLYYIYIVAAFYLITPPLKIIINFGTKEIKSYFYFLVAFFCLSATAAMYFLQIPLNVSTIFTVWIPFFLYYLTGDYFRHTKLSKKQFYLCLALFISALVLTALGTRLHMSYLRDVAVGKQVIDYGKYFYDYVSIPVAIMSVIAFIVLHNLPTRYPRLIESKVAPAIVSLAGASFGIYLIHPLFLEFSNRILKIPFEALPIPLWIFLFIKLSVLLIISYGVVIIIKRIPFLKLLV